MSLVISVFFANKKWCFVCFDVKFSYRFIVELVNLWICLVVLALSECGYTEGLLAVCPL